MSLNCNEIDTVLAELKLEGSFIQQVVQPSFDTIALYTYKEGASRTILICLAAGACRLHHTEKKVPKTEKPLRFMEFLRSRIKGCRINSAAQVAHERIIKLQLSRGDSSGAELGGDSVEIFAMYIRLWSGAANIIVTNPLQTQDESELILDVFYRRPKRSEMSGEFFLPPSLGSPSATLDRWPVRSFDEVEIADDEEFPFNRKVEKWYAEHSAELSLSALLAQAEKLYVGRSTRLEAAIRRLQKKRGEFLTADQWRHQGDLILSNAHLFKACKESKAVYLECEDYATGNMVRLQIDCDKTAQANALEYYQRYKKAVSGLEELERDIELSQRELQRLTVDFEKLKLETNPLVVRQKMRRQENSQAQKNDNERPGLAFTVSGWQILVGRNATENDALLRHHVKGNDLWLHTRDWPGGYVFVKNQAKKTIPLEVLLDAGNLAVFYSKGRKAAKADVYYTQVKYLRRVKGTRTTTVKGKVLPTNEKNLSIELDSERLKKIEESQKDI